VPKVLLGFIIGQFSFIYIITSIIIGKYLSTTNRSAGLRFGLCFVVVQLLILGGIYYVENMYLFIFLAFLAQTLGGIGAGFNSTCGLAIITSCFPDDRETNLAIMAAGVGIGMLLGPLFGAVLYTIGGYILPFWFVAFLCMALYPTLTQVIDFIGKREQELVEGKNKSSDIIDSEQVDAESGER